MTRQWIMVASSILTLSAAILLFDALLVGLYHIVTGSSGNFIGMLSNVIFVEGGLILLIGAFIEFFHILGKESVIYAPKILFPIGGWRAEPGSGDRVEVKSPGWVLIFLGGLLAVCSVAILLPFGI